MCRSADLEGYMRACEEVVESAARSDWGDDTYVVFDRVEQSAVVVNDGFRRRTEWSAKKSAA